MRDAVRALRRDERGIALVMALLVMFVLAIALTSGIYFTSTNSRTASYAKAEQTALGLAQAGTNNALAVLENPTNSAYLEPDPVAGGPPLLPSSWVGKDYEGGRADWMGSWDGDREIWTITGRGTVRNPTGPTAAPVVRTVQTTVHISWPPTSLSNLKVWNWVYAAGVGQPCDTTFLNQGAMLTPVYIVGNLCLQNQANVQAPTYVGGKLYNAQPGTGVGMSSSPVSDAFIGNGCQYKANGAYFVPCQTGSKTNVYATSLVTSGAPPAAFADLATPHVCWDEAPQPAGCGSWYKNASPGPYHPCWDTTQRQYGPDGTTSSSGPVPAFDRMVWNATLQRWVPDGGFNEIPGGDAPNGPFNLTPDVSYTCKTSRGELSWDAVTNTLKVKGVIFIDGDATVQMKTNVVGRYVGQGVLYLAGSFFMGSSKLCAAAAASDCNWGAWNPNTTLLIIATHSDDRQPNVLPGDGVEVKSSSFQGGFYADKNINLDTSSQVQGPLVTAGTITMGNKFSSSFPSITILPLGIPGDAPTPYTDPPSGFGG
jgi:hypothetical protein